MNHNVKIIVLLFKLQIMFNLESVIHKIFSMKKTLFSFLLVTGSCAAFAQWTQIPKEGGALRDVIVTPGGILAATEGGVYKSTNTATSWTYSSNGLFTADSSIACSQFAQTSTAYFVASNNGIAKTTDDGATWVSAGNAGITGSGGSFTGLVAVGNKLYTCKNVNMNTYQIFTSTNDGANWTPGANVFSSNNYPKLFSIGGTVYVTKTDSVFSTATGATLSALSYSNFPVTGNQFGFLYGDANYLYAGFDDGGSGLYRFNIAGNTWQTMSSGISPFAFSAGPFLVNNTLYASVLTFSMTLESYKSTDQGTTWTPYTLSGMTKNFIQNLYSLGGTNMLAYNPIDQLNTSSNSGSTWTQHVTGFKADMYKDQNNLTYANGNLIATENLSLIYSGNSGTSWTTATGGLPTTLHFNNKLYNANNTVYTSFQDLAGTYLYKSTDGALTWTASTLPAGVNDHSFWGHSNTALYIRTQSNLYRSTTGGASWTDITANLTPSYNFGSQFVNDGANTYAVATSTAGYQIFKSTDDGSTWTPLSMVGIPNNSYLGDNIFMNGGTLMSLWADYSAFPATYKMCTYTGTNWTAVTSTGLPPNVFNTCMNCNNYSDGSKYFIQGTDLYYMTVKGLFKSADNGATFTSFDTGFYPGVITSRMATDGTKLFAGTEGNSIWIYAIPTGLTTNTKLNEGVAVYPNPASSQITISYNEEVANANSKVIITDMLGALVQEVSLPGAANKVEISTAKLNGGIYFYTIIAGSKKSTTQKLVIAK